MPARRPLQRRPVKRGEKPPQYQRTRVPRRCRSITTDTASASQNDGVAGTRSGSARRMVRGSAAAVLHRFAAGRTEPPARELST